jgi:hypothetical protein
VILVDHQARSRISFANRPMARWRASSQSADGRRGDGFSDRQVELQETAFADQVVIALELTRLFDEIQEKARQLALTGERQEELIGPLRLWLSPELYKLNLSGEEPRLKIQRAEITVVFCDLRGYTAFADRARPKRILEMLCEYLGVLRPLINQYDGTLERFTGDGVMVFFNAPEPCPGREQQAVAWRSRCGIGCGTSASSGAANAFSSSASVSVSTRISPPPARSASRTAMTKRLSVRSPTVPRDYASTTPSG